MLEKKNVELKVNGKSLKPTSYLPKFQYESIYGDSIFKIDLGTIQRYSKTKSAELIFKDLKRIAEFNINTNYSLINIQADHIKNSSYYVEREKIMSKNLKKYKETKELPEIPDTIEVLENEEVIIYHKVPKRKHSW